jgi:hypothetical protein
MPSLISPKINESIATSASCFLNHAITFGDGSGFVASERTSTSTRNFIRIRVQHAQGIDYRFSDSKADAGIQLADVAVGLIGKYQDFVEMHRLPELMARKKAWSAAQTETFDLLRGLINYSDDVSNAFIHRITAMDSEWKNDTFMHGLPPPPHLY